MAKHRVTRVRSVFHTPWFDLVARFVDYDDERPFYSVQTDDYVTVVPVTSDGGVVLVRQYRPAVEKWTLEFPAGHVDPGQSPEDAARAELEEETAHTAAKFESLGVLHPDTGRLSNRMWCFAAKGVVPLPIPRDPEAGIEVVIEPVENLGCLMDAGVFDHALHIAAANLATRKGFLRS